MSAHGEIQPVDPVETALERQAEQIPKVNLPKLLDYNLEKLELVYQKTLRNAVDEDHRKAIALSQEAWRKFYEADGAVAAWNAKGGSFAYPAQVQQKVYQIKLRMYQLSTPFLQGWSKVPTIPNPSTEKAAPSDGDKPAN